MTLDLIIYLIKICENN